jgi:pilus assembly protein CpaB
MQLPKKYIPFLVAGIMGIIAVFLINVYIQQARRSAAEDEIRRAKMFTPVVVAKKDIASGVTIEDAMVEEKKIRKDFLQPNALTDVDRAIGKISLAPIAKGEQVLGNKVTLTGQEVSLSSKVPKDKRALTIPVDNITSVGGMLRPGDHVDILGLIPIPMPTAEGKMVNQLSTIPLFQDVLVLAVGQDYTAVPGGEKAEKKLSPIITIALAPEEANLVAFVQEQGKIRLVLRSPQDTKKQVAVPATWESVLRAVRPDLFVEKPVEPQKPKKTVEIIRGLTKEVKELE